MDIIDYFERNYRQLLLSAVMMIKDVDKAQDILHKGAEGAGQDHTACQP